MAKKKSKKKKNKDLSQDLLINIQSIHFSYERLREAELSKLELSNEQFNVLQIVYQTKEQALSLKQIQAALPNKTSNTTRLVQKLHLKNFLTKSVVKSDKRALRISLTENGKTILEQAEQHTSGLMKKLNKSLSNIQDKTLLEKLELIKKALQ